MTEFPEQLVYGTSAGWSTTGEYRTRVNPNRSWWNAWIEPKMIVQARMTKTLVETHETARLTQRLYKWSSVNSRYLVEDSED